jgi:dephospho-CoA kinase
MNRRIGLTGGIGSGKSTVARMLAARGAVVIDADRIVHELQAPGTPALAEIVAAFGPEVLRNDGSLDRPALGAIVFREPEARARLNAILHPRVGAEMARREREAREAGAPVIVLDIPLLLEGRSGGTGTAARLGFDAIVVVWVPEDVQVTRTCSRDGCDAAEARRRIAAQLPLDEKRELADHVIDNSGSLEQTQRQVDALWEKLDLRAKKEPA